MSVKISIITPSYNQAKYLEETIQSVISQRDQIHEYFVLDGGSTDGSVDIIKKYEKHIDWWISEKDKGQSDAIHRGFSKATGDVIAWLNSDDVYFPQALSRVKQAFDTHPNWDVLTGYSAWIDAESRIEKLWRIPKESRFWADLGVMHVCQQTCFFKRSFYEKVGGLNLDLHMIMDTELWFRFMDANAVWGHIPEYLAGFRHHDLAKGTTWTKTVEKEHIWALEHYPQYLNRPFKHFCGKNLYRLIEIFSLNRCRSIIHTMQYKNKSIGNCPLLTY